MPNVMIFAGANGSGKTTLAHTVLEANAYFINADEIREKGKLSYLDAGERALNEIDQHIGKGETFAFETTMSGLGLEKRLRRLREKGYAIQIFYLFAHPLDLLKERIKERRIFVIQGQVPGIDVTSVIMI